MVVPGKRYLEAYPHKVYICLINNTSQIYFTLGRTDVHWRFSSLLRDAPDNSRFRLLLRTWLRPTSYWNAFLWISEPTLCMLEKFQHRLAKSLLKLFLCTITFETNVSLIYWCFGNWFAEPDTPLKKHHTQTFRTFADVRFVWCSCGVW